MQVIMEYCYIEKEVDDGEIEFIPFVIKLSRINKMIKPDVALLCLTDEIVQQVTFRVIPVEVHVRSQMGTIFFYSSVGFMGCSIPVCVGEFLFG
jgi:hypothetical protein